MKKLLTLISIILAVLAFTALNLKATPLENLLENYVENSTSPNTWKTQERGFYTLGGFSARWPMNPVNVWHVTPPRFNAGCGGIDIMWGAFNMINLDELVNKMQQVVAAAPAYAFKLAFQQLCQPCAYVMGSIEATADFLNGLNFDQCKATQQLASWAVDIAKSHGVMLKLGMEDPKSTAYDETKEWLSNFSQQARNFVQSILPHSDEQEKRIGKSNLAGTQFDNFILAEALEDVLADDHIDFIRLLIGDVHIKLDTNDPDSAPVVESMSAGCANATQSCPIDCPKTPADAIKYLLGGRYTSDGYSYLCGKNTQNECYCTQLQGTYTDYILTQINSIYSKIDTTHPLTEEEQDFVDMASLPIIPVLRIEKRMLKGTGYSGLIPVLAETIAWDWIYGALQNAIFSAETEMQRLKAEMSAHVTEFDAKIEQNISRMLRNAAEVRKQIDDLYMAALNRLNSKLNAIASLIEIERQAMRILLKSQTGRTLTFTGG